ncbi:TATA-box-binding protein [Nothobranchius furzeri]|uniref:TATA-box-binding protein-like n=1 Tax=Nothobranchius furzeri TaxID=105023 RepID=A0A8C6L6V7_NOTFU|nr:uncharacterized protein LOC107387238 [Nothobranchius furzeri]KAF7203660.1 TATA-box-binding protein-like [Nothobranchius furzeri]
MKTSETPYREVLKRNLEEFTAEMKKEEEETEGEGEELLTCSGQDDSGDSGSTTSDMLPQTSSSSVPPSALNTPVDFCVHIQSVTSRVNLVCELDLKHICNNTWNAEYSSQVLTLQLRRPRATARIFRNGKLICMGAQSVEDSHLAARRFARIVQKHGFNVRFHNFRISNMVATSSFFPVSLDQLHNAHREHSRFLHSHDQGISNCLKFKMDMGITAKIFPTGNAILLGAKSLTDLHEAVKTLFNILSSFMTF